MRQLIPVPGEVDPIRSYLAAERPAPDDRPWVALSMVSSVDGATAIGGRSGPLGGAPDREVFRAVRAVADVVMVAAGTARTERYGPVLLSDAALAARAEFGRAPGLPRLAVVSRSLDLAGTVERFAEHEVRPLILTTEDADRSRWTALEEVAEVRAYGRGDVALGLALADLRDAGVGVVVCEGGPTLNASFVEADLADEWCVTLAPVIAGGDSRRLVAGAPELGPAGQDLELVSLLEADGVLMGRWTRRR